MKKHKGKTKRWLAGVLSAVLVIGSINLVDALEGSNGESALYDAPELTITQGATDYDLMEGITYDNSLYELAIVDENGFDVNTVGDYEVTYSLTSKDDGTLDPGDSGNGEVKDPDDTKNPTDTEDSKNENGSSESGDASNSDNENKDQNSGDNQEGDNTQTGDNSDNAGSDNGSDSSDSSNAGDNADAGQGDTNSDSSNAGDSADAGQEDTNSDSSNAEDTADAVSGEDAAQSEENTVDTGVLGVSRPRTAVNMSYQSEPVDAEAVDVTEGDATNTGDTQEKQVISFTRMVHVVAASEDEVPVYVTRELVLIQGEEVYDLTDDILYDDVNYTLDVVELGGFDINKIGSYEVTYSLTPVTTEGTQGNGQDDAQEKQVITFQRTVTVKAAGEENALYEAPDLYLECGQEEYDLTEGIIYDKDLYEVKVSDPGDFDINMVGEYEVTYVLDRIGKSAKGEDIKTSKLEETTVTDEQKSEDNDGIQAATLELTDEKQSVDPADGDTTNSTEEKSSEVKTASLEAVYFTRNVIVEVLGVNYSFRNAVAYANVQGKYVVNLGTPVWTDDTHTKFQYTNVKIDTEGEDISLMTITLSNGRLPAGVLNDTPITDDYGRSATWIFMNKKSSQEIEEKIKSIVFDYVNDMNVYVSINGNDNEGFDEQLDQLKLTQWSVNGHYYLFLPEITSWSAAYLRAKDFKLGGMQGYLATFSSTEEEVYLATLNRTGTWTGGTRLLLKNGQRIENSMFRRTRGVLIGGETYYWASGPEAGSVIPSNLGSSVNSFDKHSAVDGALDATIYDIQGHESCLLLRANDKTLNDIIEGNYRGDSKASGLYVEFGGYADGADLGQPDNTKKGETNVLVAPKDAEASINGVKYAPLADALDLAEDGDEVQIIKENVTEVTDGTLKTGVQLKSFDGNTTYTGKLDSKIDVAADGGVTVTGGKISVTANAALKVKSPVDSNIYEITTPSGDTEVIVPETEGGDKTPYVMNDSTTGSLSLKVGDVTYTYNNQSSTAITMVYIPDAMYNNEQVKKAEVDADKNVEIKVDAADSVVTKGGGSSSNKITVVRRTTDQRTDVKLPVGATATVFGHKVAAAPANGATISQSNTANSGYPTRDFVRNLEPDESIEIDGITYAGTDNIQRYYLGKFDVNITNVEGAQIEGSTPAKPGYFQEYTIKFSPKKHYDLDMDHFTVTMKKSDTGAEETLKPVNVCKEEADGSVTVTIPQVTGDITIEPAVIRQTATINVEGLTAGGAKGIFTATDASGKTQKLMTDGEITVDLDEELTLTFTPNDFTNTYYEDLIGEEGASFSVLTALEETTDNNNSLFGSATFDWVKKSYELKYTPTKKVVTLKTTFTPSHVVHIHVSGGTAEVTDTSLVTREKGASHFQQVIVPNNQTVDVTLKDTTANGMTPIAYWIDLKQNPTDAGTNVSGDLQGGSKTYTYTTPAVTKPHALNVTFEEGQEVEVTVTNGTVVNDDHAWTENAGTYTRIVKNNSPLELEIKPTDSSYVLKSITINGYAIDIEQAKKDGLLEYDEAKGVYKHTTQGIYQAWKVNVDLEKQHQFEFRNQNDTVIAGGENITVVEGGTIPKSVFTQMQVATDNLKAKDETFFAWVDKANTGKVYNASTVIDSTTADKVTLIPVYRTNVITGDDGSVLAADDFIIRLNDVKNLTVNDAKTRANVKAYDANGADITSNVTVDSEQLTALKGKGEGVYQNALTFRIDKGAEIRVTVEVTNANPEVKGKTAHTLTFTGRAKTEYNVQKKSSSGGLEGDVLTFTTDENGKATATGLDKATEYQIYHTYFGSADGKTALVDAEEIADRFKDENDTTSHNGKTDKNESASNKNVEVSVDDDGNYKVTVKNNINHTVEIPDSWGNVKVDLGGHTITGDAADENNQAKPGLEFIKDAATNEHPGTRLEITNGTIKGGDGSAAQPDGAPGIGTGTEKPSNAEVVAGNGVKVIGGNGANGTNGNNGGNGGAGISGEITPTVDHGSVTGGKGGNGGDSATDKPGNGGNGGAGISVGNKTVTINNGTVKGGDAGKGGNATGDNTNPGGNGGNGGTGAEGGDINNNGGNISGGNGGSGGNSNNGGNGGNPGNGGDGTKGNHNPTNGGTSTNGKDGQNGTAYVEVLFKNQNGGLLNAANPYRIEANGKITQATFDQMKAEADKLNTDNKVFFAWVDEQDETKVYAADKEVTASVTLIPVYRADSNIVPGQDGNTIAADNFSIRIEEVKNLTEAEAKKLANVKAYNQKGEDITQNVAVKQDTLTALQQKTEAGQTSLTFEIPGSVTVSVTVEIMDDKPVITGKTASALAFRGIPNETYEYQERNEQGSLTGSVQTIQTDAEGKATITGLKKATEYQISHKKYGSVIGKTALVDAMDIARRFEDKGANDTSGSGVGKDETAGNSNVDVVVDENGNYKVTVKKDIDHTVEIPDTWGEVKIDLNGKTITGDQAGDSNAAKPGLDFVKDGSTKEHPGTKLEIMNGTIKGGNGSSAHPNGAPGIGTDNDTVDAELIIGNNANVFGGNGAHGSEGKDGGNGGAGIAGNSKITPTVNGGNVTGGNGGNGGDSATGKPGNGGDGGAGISAGTKNVTINSGTVKGGNAGKGGNATGDNKNPGGTGGNGGNGTETEKPGKTDNNGGTTSGGNGGNGGDSNNGSGGNGGNGGNGSTGDNNNNGGNNSGGNGGNGGDSDKGNGGSGGNGGNSGETGGSAGNNNGGNGGNGGNSDSGNGGSGGNGGNSGNGTGGNGGNGGSSDNGNGGTGGNGGSSDNGNGGNGGNGGDGKDPGTGGNGGGSTGGNGGNSGGNGNKPGGNGGGSTGGNGGGSTGGNGGGSTGGNGGNSGGNGNKPGGNGGGSTGGNSNKPGGNGGGSTGGNGNKPGGNSGGNSGNNGTNSGSNVSQNGNSTGSSRFNDSNTELDNADQYDSDSMADGSLDGTLDESGYADGAENSSTYEDQEEETVQADSDSVVEGTDSEDHIPFGECGFHWIPIVWLLVILGYTVVRVKKLRDESEEA